MPTLTATPPPGRRAMPPPWVRWSAWTAIVAPLPYSLSRLVWAAGIPLGIDRELLREFDTPGLGSLYILCLALLPEATALFTHAFVLRRRRTVPLTGGRRARPAFVAAVLGVPIVILAAFNAWSLGPIADGFTIPAGNAGVAAWSFWGQVATFWIWGLALTAATAGHWWTSRRPGPAVAA